MNETSKCSRQDDRKIHGRFNEFNKNQTIQNKG